MKKNRKFIVLLVLFFFQGVFTNIHHPLMPSYVANLKIANYMFGFFFAFMNLGMLFGAPFWGSLADSGRKRLAVTLGFSIYGIFQLLFGLGNIFGPWLLSLMRFFSGFGIAAAFAVLASEVIIISEKENRAKNIAFGAAILAIGGAFGQFLGGLMYTNKFLIRIFKTDQIFNVLLIQFILALLLALYTVVFYQPEPILNNKNTEKPHFLSGFKQLKKLNLDLILFLLALSLITIAAVNVDKYLDVYFINILGYRENILGQFKMIVGLVAVLTSFLIVPFFMKIKKRLFVISIFQALSAIIIFVIFYETSFSFICYLYTLYLGYIVIKAINEPLEREYISNYSEKENMATIMGVRHSFYSLGTIIGPIFGAFLYDYQPKMVFYSSAIIFLLAIVLIFSSSILRNKQAANLSK
ncbi:MAG: MFS transporter [Acholeplasmataceae bacterium]|nr:MFS transporter [Acholeplasmataceae bacterium]